MSIKVTFDAGSYNKTVQGLYQWDYGRVLEIEDFELGSELIEVHFACSGMTEAIVRPCNFVNGVGTVTIPNQCLEQASEIIAWIYRINGTEGHTWKTITLPVTARTRPNAKRDIPAEVIERYTELISEVEEAVESLESGSITVASAKNAGSANFANTANIAEYASHDTSKGTIEERLTTLGYKESNITPVEGSSTLLGQNILLRQGYYVIGIFKGKWEADSKGYPYVSGEGYPIGTVPEAFRPAAGKSFLGSVWVQDSYLANISEQLYIASAGQSQCEIERTASAEITLGTDGVLRIEYIEPMVLTFDTVPFEVYVSLGYQLDNT